MPKTPEQQLAYEVLSRDGQWGMTGCLMEAKSAVALRGFDVLDEFSPMHVRVLALLCSGEGCAASAVQLHLNLDANDFASYLHDLALAEYADDQTGAWLPTQKGKDIIRQVGIEMLGLDLFRMEGATQAAERLLKEVRNGAS
jgi:hypothetical protein